MNTPILTFDLTPQYKIVPTGVWGRSAPALMTSSQDIINIESMRELEQYYGIRARLDSISINKNKWPTDIMRQIYESSDPLRELREAKTTVKLTPEWLTFWEVYARTLTPSLIARMQRRRSAKKGPPRPLPFRTLHVHDNGSESVSTMQKVINKVEFEGGMPLAWDWLAIAGPRPTHAETIEMVKDPRWLKSPEGDTISVGNMRSWRNKISIGLKTLDAIIIDSKAEEDTAASIAFALINIGAGGSVIISLPRVAAASVVSMIYLLAQCFEKTTLIHTMAEDRMFVYGDNYLAALTAKHHKMLYEYCELEPGATNQSPFVSAHVESAEFGEILDKVIVANTSIQRWRYEYYDTLLTINDHLVKSVSNATFENYIGTYLADRYKDESKRWIATTGFNFFAQV